MDSTLCPRQERNWNPSGDRSPWLALRMWGGVVTGCTMANFSAITAARYALLERAGWDVVSKGLYGAPEIKVVVSDEVHASVLKALSLVGFVVTAFTGYP